MTRAAAPGVLQAPGFGRLWLAGGLASTSMWLELLAAALFTLAATGSPLAVALVSAARAAPLLLAGALMGVVADALDRLRIVMAGLLVTALSSACVALLAAVGLLRPWHVGVAALVSGLVYATEMPARRRLIGEIAGPALIGRAIAVDSVTGFAARCLGPLLGGLASQIVGIGGAYALSMTGSLLAACCLVGVRSRQTVRALSFATVRQDLVVGARYAVASRRVAMLLGTTLVMNVLGYSYTALVAPFGRLLLLDDVRIGLLAAAEPAGALLGGLALIRMSWPGSAVGWLGGGAAVLMAALVAAPLASFAAPLWGSGLVLMLGGLGVAVYTNMQTLIVLRSVPAELRSRVLGLVGTAVGGWPIGQLLAGGLAESLAARNALMAIGGTGLICMLGLAAAGKYASSRRRAADAVNDLLSM